MNTIEEKLLEKQAMKEIKELFPKYDEVIKLQDGKSKMCKVFGHKTRQVHHAFYTKQTERGKEYYECWFCPRCKDVKGKLVRIVK